MVFAICCLVCFFSVRVEKVVSELLAHCVQTIRSDSSFLVGAAHGLVTLVAWHLHLIVLNNVLLNNGITIAQSWGLSDGARVEVGLRNETIVAWDVSGGLGRTDRQLVMLIGLALCFTGEFGTRVVAMCANRLLELCLEVAALWSVCLARITPDGALRNGYRCSHLLFVRHLWVWLPVLGCATEAHLVLTGSLQHSTVLVSIVFGFTCVSKECRIVHHIILDYINHYG